MTEGGGGSEKVEISVTSFMNGPLHKLYPIPFYEADRDDFAAL